MLVRRWRLTILSAVVAGFLIGAGPAFLFFSLFGPDASSVNGVPTRIDGALTVAGWLDVIEVAGLLGCLGALAGALFFCAVLSWPKGQNQNRQSVRWVRSLTPPVTAALACGVIFAIPEMTRDRTCHNSLRDGRSSIGPEIIITLRVGPDEWNDVGRFLDDTGKALNWSIRKNVQDYSEDMKRFHFSMCNPEGTNISVNEMLFPNSGRPPSDFLTRAVEVTVYQPQGGESWKEPTRLLVESMVRRWPGRIAFMGYNSESVAPPDWLAPALEPPARQ